MTDRTVIIGGRVVPLSKLRDDTRCEIKAGTPQRAAFSAIEVEALLNAIADMQARLEQIEKLAKD